MPHDPVLPTRPQADALDAAALLRASASQLAAMIESAMDAVITIDEAQQVVLFNQAAEAMFGRDAASVLGQPLELLIPVRHHASHAAHVRTFGTGLATTRRMGQGRPVSGLRANGEEFPAEASISHTEVQGRTLFTVILRDVTDRVQGEQRLREQRQTLAAIIDAASDAVVSTDERGHITLFNPAAERIFGYGAAQMLGQPLERLMPARYRARHDGDLQGFVRSGVTRRAMGAGRVKGLAADGAELELDASISQSMVNGRLTLTAILRDMTQRVRAETELLRYQVELSELAQQLMTQEKTTTRRLAQALHDQLGQTLTALRLMFDLQLAGAPGGDGPGAARGQRISGLIDEAIRQVRQVLVELRPPMLDDNGLAAALDNELRTRDAALDGIDLLLEVEPEVAALRWPADVEYAAFMVAREALGNAILHAEATLVRVVLQGTADHFRLEVVDDGRGIGTQGFPMRPGHLGMVGMRERALAIGARFSLDIAHPATGAGEPEGAARAARPGTTVRLEWQA